MANIQFKYVISVIASRFFDSAISPIKFNVKRWNEKIQGTIYCG